MSTNPSAVIGTAIFEDLQRKIDEDTAVKDALRDIVQKLEKQNRSTQAILSKSHSTLSQDLSPTLTAAQESIRNEVHTIGELAVVASREPYYKYSYAWTYQIQNSCFVILLTGYLGGFGKDGTAETGRLLGIEEVGALMQVPVNLKTSDAFHLTIEEYLHALISLIDELARLARNCVTLGDYARPLQISRFIKDVHAGFQILNLRNDALRKRSDGVKYRVKEVEDVVYDLSLRGLLPKG